ncbi:MAG: NAD-dependent epimerase/dehydratase family protein [bacterium]
MSRTAFVTGASGFLGVNLVEQLCAAGWQVVALHRHTSSTSWLRRFPARTVVGDVLDARSLLAAIPPDVDAVVHTAADLTAWRARRQRQWRTNVEGTWRVLEAAQRRRAKAFVYTSSFSAYGLQTEEIREDTPQRGRFSPRFFERTKAEAERAVRQAGHARFPTCILQPGYLIGRYDRGGFAGMMRDVHRGRWPWVPAGEATFCHAAAVARAHIAAAERGARDTWLLGGADAPFTEVVRLIGQVTDREVPGRPTKPWRLRLRARLAVLRASLSRQEPSLTPDHLGALQKSVRISSDRAERDLGYRPVPLREMLEDTWAWLKAEGLL